MNPNIILSRRDGVMVKSGGIGESIVHTGCGGQGIKCIGALVHGEVMLGYVVNSGMIEG